MERISQEQLDAAVELHTKWIANDPTGKRMDLQLKDLTGLDFKKFRSADLSYANLSSADLSSADLSYANLRSADLSSADLSSADLSSADLRYANLRYADLSSADLSYANLRYAKNIKTLAAECLIHFKRDIRLILFENQHEVDGLLSALKAGKVDGSVYKGDCACLMGTIANVRKCSVDTLEQDASRPAEQWFLGINKGDTPESNEFSELATKWIEEWTAQYGIVIPAKPKTHKKAGV